MLASSAGDEKRGRRLEKRALDCAFWGVAEVVCVQRCACKVYVSVCIYNQHIIYKQHDCQMTMMACSAFSRLALVFSGHHSSVSFPSSQGRGFREMQGFCLPGMCFKVMTFIVGPQNATLWDRCWS